MSSGIYLFLYFFFAVLVFLIRNVQLHLIIAVCVTFALFFMPLKKVKSGFVPILLFLGFTFISNLFYQSGEVVAVLGPLTVTGEGFRTASVRMLRVFDMVYAAKILSCIMPLEAMIASLRKALHPLERIGLPVHDFFSVMALTLQCFPVLKQKLYDKYSEETKHMSIPAAGRSGIKGIISNAGTTVSMLASFMIPLFVESMADPEKFFMTANLTDAKDKKL
ncbi:MAG: energy-coupling factor transporter transmembrane component T [Dissulfurispiraceae bacterium]